MPEGVWSSKLRELTDTLVAESNASQQALVAKRAARKQAQTDSIANQMAIAAQHIRDRADRSTARAQAGYQNMLNQMSGGNPMVQSGSSALNGVKGKGPSLGKAGITTNPREMTTIHAAGQSVQVNKQYQSRFIGFITDLAKTGYDINTIGGYNVRNIAGTGTTSLHSYGAAIDINSKPNARGGSGNLPPHIAELAAKYGLVWGGNWRYTDPMHFEIAGLMNPVKLKR